MDIKIDKSSCRVCFKNVGVIPLFSDYGDGVPAETISSLFNIYISCAVNLPNAICEICMEHIKIAISSKEAIIYAENMLNDYLASNNSFEIEQEENFPINENDISGHYLPKLDNLDDLEYLKIEHKDDKIVDSFKCYEDISLELISSQLYECLKCEVKTDTYKQLILHMRSHSDIALYECETCGKEYKRRSRYVKHAFRHYNNRPCKCDECGKAFKEPHDLTQHLLTHQTERILPCQHCGKTFCHMKGLKAHLLTHNEKTVGCEICGKLFKHSTFLKTHIGLVHGIRTGRSGNKYAYSPQRVTCEFCGKLMAYSNLKKHIDAQHSDSIAVKSNSRNAINCLYCNKSFLTNLGLKMHMQTHINTKKISLDIKTKEKYLKYKCDECDKCFVSAVFLKTHKILHSGVKEHPCPYCGKEFAFKMYLDRHVRLLHDTTNPRNFNCHICGKVSACGAARKSHMLSHTRETPFECKFCGSKFVYAKSLRIHINNKHKTEINENRNSEKT